MIHRHLICFEKVDQQNCTKWFDDKDTWWHFVFFCKEKWHFVLFFAVKWVSEKAIGHEQIVVAKFVWKFSGLLQSACENRRGCFRRHVYLTLSSVAALQVLSLCYELPFAAIDHQLKNINKKIFHCPSFLTACLQHNKTLPGISVFHLNFFCKLWEILVDQHHREKAGNPVIKLLNHGENGQRIPEIFVCLIFFHLN